jgi:hypothetical protein
VHVKVHAVNTEYCRLVTPGSQHFMSLKKQFTVPVNESLRIPDIVKFIILSLGAYGACGGWERGAQVSGGEA